MAMSKLDEATVKRKVIADIEGHHRPTVYRRPREDLIVRPPAKVVALGDSDDVVPETAELDCNTR